MAGLSQIRIICSDVLAGLKTLPDNSIQCCVTSPPYLGLRDYGIEGQIWPDGWKGSYGLEPTPELYIQHTVEIFREVKRVLRSDGCLFLNMGDSYMAHVGYQNPQTKDHKGSGFCGPNRTPQSGLKPKDLCGIPWGVALALRADGWWLRSDIVWSKPNPMPESVTDRPTKAHEYIFLLTKSVKYYWDQEAVRETNQSERERGRPNGAATFERFGVNSSCGINPNGRNLRSIWTIATVPFPEAHFATFPPAIPERCIKAGTSEKGCCPKCGAGWKRVVEKKFVQEGPQRNRGKIKSGDAQAKSMTMGDKGFVGHNDTTTLGWQPSCSCGLDPVPQTVLDPFSGAGTTAMVAAKLGRDAVGIELSPEYVEMSVKRLKKELGMLAEIIQ